MDCDYKDDDLLEELVQSEEFAEFMDNNTFDPLTTQFHELTRHIQLGEIMFNRDTKIKRSLNSNEKNAILKEATDLANRGVSIECCIPDTVLDTIVTGDEFSKALGLD